MYQSPCVRTASNYDVKHRHHKIQRQKKIDLKRTPESKIEKQYIGQECWKRNPD